MVSTGSLGNDTTPEIAERVVQRWREMSAVEKMALVDELNQTCATLATAGVRQRHPDANEREVRLRVLALSVDRELMVAAYDWDPHVEGY